MWNPFKPKIENSDPGQRSLQLISQKGMPFAYVEAYKSLRTNLNFLTSSTGARAIVVTSTMPEEAKSNVSVNLALTLAEDGKNVALVDCDLRKPVLHKYPESRSQCERRFQYCLQPVQAGRGSAAAGTVQDHVPARRHAPSEPLGAAGLDPDAADDPAAARHF